MGDYHEKDLQAKMDKPRLVGDIVENFMRICPDRQAVVFATGVKHSIHLAENFVKAGFQAAHLDGKTKKDDRDKILQDLSTGRIQIVVNCMVLTEGWDCPVVSCCILARPTKSFGLYLQMAGRVLRPSPGKDNCIIIDHSGAYFEHGPIDRKTDWHLRPHERIEEEEGKKEERQAVTIICKECKFVYEGLPKCPSCGHEPVRKGQMMDYQEGNLARVGPDGEMIEPKYTYQEKKNFYLEIKHIQEGRDYNRGWSYHKYVGRFNEKPKWEWQKMKARNPSQETINNIREQAALWRKRQSDQNS